MPIAEYTKLKGLIQKNGSVGSFEIKDDIGIKVSNSSLASLGIKVKSKKDITFTGGGVANAEGDGKVTLANFLPANSIAAAIILKITTAAAANTRDVDKLKLTCNSVTKDIAINPAATSSHFVSTMDVSMKADTAEDVVLDLYDAGVDDALAADENMTVSLTLAYFDMTKPS